MNGAGPFIPVCRCASVNGRHPSWVAVSHAAPHVAGGTRVPLTAAGGLRVPGANIARRQLLEQAICPCRIAWVDRACGRSTLVGCTWHCRASRYSRLNQTVGEQPDVQEHERAADGAPTRQRVG